MRAANSPVPRAWANFRESSVSERLLQGRSLDASRRLGTVIQAQADELALGISQSRLARMSGVSRFKICSYELGDSSLTADEQNRIR